MSVAAGLVGAWMLAQGRADGLAHVPTGRSGAARSFWAAAICLPAFAALRTLDWAELGWPSDLPHAIALEGLGFVITWVGFVLLTQPIVVLLRREPRWTLFVAAWNWSNVAQYAILLIASIPSLFGAPDWFSQTVGLVAIGWVLWVEWYATRVALAISRVQAAALVVLDLSFTMLVDGLMHLT